MKGELLRAGYAIIMKTKFASLCSNNAFAVYLRTKSFCNNFS